MPLLPRCNCINRTRSTKHFCFFSLEIESQLCGLGLFAMAMVGLALVGFCKEEVGHWIQGRVLELLGVLVNFRNASNSSQSFIIILDCFDTLGHCLVVIMEKPCVEHWLPCRVVFVTFFFVRIIDVQDSFALEERVEAVGLAGLAGLVIKGIILWGQASRII